MATHDLVACQTLLKMIGKFEHNTITIHIFIARLEDLLNLISDGDEIWRDNFFQNWAPFEIARAISLSEERASLNEYEMQKVLKRSPNLNNWSTIRLRHAKYRIDRTIEPNSNNRDDPALEWFPCPTPITAIAKFRDDASRPLL